MGLLEELKERADKLDAEYLALASRMKEIARESQEVATCINALDIAEMDAEEADDAEDATTVFDEGRLAYHEGRPSNPYSLETLEGQAWHDGFVSEADEALREKEASASAGYQHVVDAAPVNYEPAPIIADPSSVEELGEQSEPFKMEEVEAEEPRDPDLVLTEAVLDEITDLAEQKLEAAPVEHPDAPFWARVLTRKKEDA